MTRTWIHLAAATTLLVSACAPKPQTALPTGDNSKNSVDWDGTYFGTLPCADCEGIETTITLKPNSTFRSEMVYLGKSSKPISTSGKFTWNASGSSITLKPKENSGMQTQYQVGENRLFQLDQQGNRVTGSLAANYELGTH